MIDRRGPEWDCAVPSWHLWQWQATMHLNGKGYKATLEGENKDDVTSGDAAVRDEYVRTRKARAHPARSAICALAGQPALVPGGGAGG